MITNPTTKPSTLKTLETDFGTTIAQSIWKRIRDQEIYINSCFPIGMVIAFWGSQRYADGSPGTRITPPGVNWKFCDGSVISDSRSPMNGYAVPDLRNRSIRGGNTYGTAGGLDSEAVVHNHYTNYVQPYVGRGGGNGDNRSRIENHRHVLGSVWQTINRLPPYVTIHYYMRIF